MSNPRDYVFISAFNQLQKEVHQTAVEKGWWDDRNKLVKEAYKVDDELGQFAEQAVAGLSMALKHSELSEGLEALRHGNKPDDKIPEYCGEVAELADTVIRAMDRAESQGYDLASAIVAKSLCNKGRGHKHGGKKF